MTQPRTLVDHDPWKAALQDPYVDVPPPNEPPDLPGDAPVLNFARDVAVEAHRIKVRECAREMHEAQRVSAAPPFDAGLLVDVLARPGEPADRVEGLIPSEAGTLIVAQRKTGKSTLLLNLAKALLEGEYFLGQFATRQINGRVAILNYEVSGAQLARWAHEARIPDDRLYLVNLRGRRNPLSHADDRAVLAEQLRAHDVESLLVDPFGRAYTGQNQNDAGEVGAWLAQLDEFARTQIGVADLILSAHAGWNGERTRGASALEDWADSIITITRDRDDEHRRFLRAIGRDVDVEEDELTYTPDTRRLTLAGTGSRKAASTRRRTEDLMPAVIQVVTARPGLSVRAIGEALTEAGHPHRNGEQSAAAKLAVTEGKLRTEPGTRNSLLHFPTERSQ